MALSALVRSSGHKVVLTGEGADELFAGYVGYRLDATHVRTTEPEDVENDAGGRTPRTSLGPAGLLLRSATYLALPRGQGQPLFRRPPPPAWRRSTAPRQPVVDPNRLRNRHPLHQRSYVDFRLRLSDHLLADHGDRVAYANSIEARYPFLDLDLIDFVRTIPPALLIKDANREVSAAPGRRQISAAVDRAAGEVRFRSPGSPYLLARNVGWINDLLSPDRIRRQNYFNPDAVERLRRRATAGRRRHHATFELDLLMIVLTFGILLESFDLPDYTA